LTVGMILYIMVEIFDRRYKKKGFNLHETTGYNICALSKHIDNMCMRLRNGGKGQAICFDSAHVLYLSCNFKS
jgi:hypothetical protein